MLARLEDHQKTVLIRHLDYLSKAQGVEKNKGGGRKGSPMYEFDYLANPL